MKKIHWRVDPKPTGPYRSFAQRGWPSGWSDKKETHAIAHITSTTPYDPSAVKAGIDCHLKVRVAIKNERSSFDWRILKGEFATLAEAKTAAQKFYEAHPEMFMGGAS